jgi:tetratricopeptide (TPR) repeat protein
VALDDPRHPDAERLAEYADGLLADEARAEVERHLAECEDCRAVVMDTMAFLASATGKVDTIPRSKVIPFPSRRWMTRASALVGVAAALLLAVRVARPEWLLGPRGDRPELQELVAAVAGLPTRPVEGRLTGGFKYAPPPSPTRGPGDRDMPPDVRIAAARLEQAASGDQPAPGALADLGVALLTLGDVNKAIDALERAVAQKPMDARYQSDLAAAYLARARREGSPADWPKALAASERALKAHPDLIEAWFNRAMAIEGAGMSPGEVRQAWQDYLTRDSSSDWARERQQP